MRKFSQYYDDMEEDQEDGDWIPIQDVHDLASQVMNILEARTPDVRQQIKRLFFEELPDHPAFASAVQLLSVVQEVETEHNADFSKLKNAVMDTL